MRYLPDDNLSYPVLVTLDNGGFGSGFYLMYNETQLYLVTARHLLYDNKKIKETDPDNFVLKAKKITILSYCTDPLITAPHVSEIDISILEPDNIIFSQKDDVVVIKIADLIQRKDSKLKDPQYSLGFKEISKPEGDTALVCVQNGYFKKFDNVLISNDVIMFGYPNSLGGGIDYHRPLLRKGIVAGKNSKDRTIIIDCPSYQGNSGGLVLEIEPGLVNRKTEVIGIVSGFVPFIEVFESLHFKYRNTSIENSGYTVVTPIDGILDLIKE